ncbi:monovalent cation/H+ antiporter subunit D family protein [Corynebacterium uberis]|uniref:monovalent cation/H+ antiporter subunit D family protein n=1 Tax=Corynebacterium TaxID=1716 RepID=UPI001D0AD1F8|nr:MULTISPECIES: monovalent cation/H+ antiporter subunit D family protein [Corynebacterium]MCZ9309933.1 monovalent cation/H+ antiporter subunit D family protein [Corynebacterium sp. c6VSa_13]UDL73146.1 monovalent cation/H+ antiporter subunit D family protein [Corynebacterium uberis]UDL75977.1 monovalent cation/H+ antiporter subunit D family protein [Corynebacterium uberis]UDL78189.1 monovalent cation/H+ antiporter subunit D family protein [Corynebacterium uberis]UDL80472.1 monovalent cation/H+
MEVLLPVFVAVPLVSSALAALAPWKWARDLLHLLIPAAGLAVGVTLFSYTADHGTIAHNVGMFAGGVAIPFAADPLTGVMMITTSLVALVANWFATASGETRARFYPALTLMLITGVYGALLTADLFNFFVFIEVMLLPSYGLIAMTGTWARLSAARTFVLVNLAASTLLVVGVAFLYGIVGTVNLGALRDVAAGGGPAVVAAGVVVVGIGAKAGVFPVHTWLPRTYPGTSGAVMGLFSALHTKIAVYMLYRIYVVVFGLEDRWNTLIIVIMVASMLIGGFAGLAENTIRRVLAYQMVNGMPFILVMLAFTSGDPTRALAAGLLYTVHHMVTVGSLVLASGAIEETYGTGMIRKLSGLARRDPWLAAIFAAGSFSVVGFPPFSGLWGKVAVVVEIARTQSPAAWIVIGTIVLASFAALLTMLRVWREVFWGRPMQHVPETLHVRASLIAPAGVLIVVSVGMFLAAGPLLDALHTATAALTNVDAYQHAILGDNPIGVPDMTSLKAGS